MNSLFDAFQVGLPGVCLDGAEPHAHADVAIFARAAIKSIEFFGSSSCFIGSLSLIGGTWSNW